MAARRALALAAALCCAAAASAPAPKTRDLPATLDGIREVIAQCPELGEVDFAAVAGKRVPEQLAGPGPVSLGVGERRVTISRDGVTAWGAPRFVARVTPRAPPPPVAGGGGALPLPDPPLPRRRAAAALAGGAGQLQKAKEEEGATPVRTRHLIVIAATSAVVSVGFLAFWWGLRRSGCGPARPRARAPARAKEAAPVAAPAAPTPDPDPTEQPAPADPECPAPNSERRNGFLYQSV